MRPVPHPSISEQGPTPPKQNENENENTTMTLLLTFLIAITPCTPGRGGTGHQIRSRNERTAFQRSHPCPSTGNTRGACPGYVVDHRIPLVCCGPNNTANLQWQTTKDAKTKDRTEQHCAA